MLQYKKNAAVISEMLETAACFTRTHRKSACSAGTIGVTEKLKAEDQMLWVQWMSAVRETEIVNNDLIFA